MRDDRVRVALAALPIELCAVMALAYGCIQVEIAAMRAIPRGTVNTRTLAAMRKLGQSLLDTDIAADADGQLGGTGRRSP